MNSKLALAPVGLAVCLAALPASGWTQTVSATASATAPATAPIISAPPGQLVQVEDRVDRKEPNVTHTVTEDGGSRIDELVVRGQVQHVVVTPKVGLTKSYEIIVQRGGREQVDGTGGATGAIGKRVWNVFAF